MVERAGERAIEQPIDLLSERSSDSAIERTIEQKRGSDPVIERAFERVVVRAIERPIELLVE